MTETGRRETVVLTAPRASKTEQMTAEQFSIESALRACAGGDSLALKAIYEREGPRMLGIANRMLRRRALAEEAVHDAFLAIWRHASRFDAGKGAGATWIYTILRNRALSILRDESRMELSEEPVGEDMESDDPDPEKIVLGLSDAGALRHCLERLETKRRHAIVLAYTEGLSHGELAGRLGMPLGTVKSWLRRGLLTLKECLQ